MKRTLLNVVVVAIALMMTSETKVLAQRHVYNRMEFGGGNAWTFMGLELASMILNDAVNYPLSEATLRFGVPSSEYGNLNSMQGFDDWNKDRFVGASDDERSSDGVISFAARDLFSNIIVGDKIGYISDRQGFMNYCVYAAAYYNLQQLKLMHNRYDYSRLNTQRFQAGGGLMLIFGSIERKNRVILDAGLRYNIPLYFSGADIAGSSNDIMNKGLSSHYMFKYSMSSIMAVGATFDMMHYNLFKDESLVGSTSKITEFGITLSFLFR